MTMLHGTRRALLGGKKTWSPLDLSGLSLWLDADDLSGIDGSVIASWISKEGNAYAFVQATAGKKPLLKKGANGISNINTALFDGTDDFLKYPAGDISNSSQGFVAIVCRITASQPNQSALSSYDEASATRSLNFKAQRNAVNPALYQADNDVADDLWSADLLVAGTPYIYIVNSSGTAYSMRINGANKALTVATGANTGDWYADTSARDNFVVGARVSSSGEGLFMKGDISQVILGDVSLSADDVTNLEKYLNDRFDKVFF